MVEKQRVSPPPKSGLTKRGRSSFLKTRVEKRKVSYPSKPGFNKRETGRDGLDFKTIRRFHRKYVMFKTIQASLINVIFKSIIIK